MEKVDLGLAWMTNRQPEGKERARREPDHLVQANYRETWIDFGLIYYHLW